MIGGSALALAACSSAGGERVGDTGEALQNGTVDPNDAPVGMLLVPDDAVGCTATLISPDVVLSADCQLAEPMSATTFCVGQGTPLPAGAAVWGLTKCYRPDAITVLPRPSSAAGKDVLLVHLSSPVLDIAPALIAQTLPAGDVRMVGYGADGITLSSTWGVRRETTAGIAAVQGDELLLATSWTSLNGDQGSPLFHDGALVGVILGPRPKLAAARLDVYASAIQSQIAAWPATPFGDAERLRVDRGYVTIAPGTSAAAYAGVGVEGKAWAAAGVRTTSIAVKANGLPWPAGISAKYVPGTQDPPPLNTIFGNVVVTAAPSVPPGAQATVTLTMDDGVNSATESFEVVVDGTCVPRACGNFCGTLDDGCSGTITCGCATGLSCRSGVCVDLTVPHCKPPTHWCGDSCQRVCDP